MLKRLLTVLLLAVAAVHAFAQPLAEHVPADAVAYVGWRGVDDPGGYEGSNFQALCESTELATTIWQVMDLIESLNPGDPEAAMAVHLIHSIRFVSWQCPTAAYVQTVEDAEKPVRFVVLWQAEGELADALAGNLSEAVRQDRSGALTSGRAGGLVWLTLAAEGQGLEKLEVKPADSLAHTPKFMETLAQADPEGMLVAYADGQGLLSLIDRTVELEANPREAEQWAKVRSALGLEGLNALAWTGGLMGKDWRTDLFIDAPAPRTGVLTLLDAEPITDAELVNVPAEATWLCAFRFDLGVLLDNVRKALVEIDPEAAQQFEDALAQGNQMTGIDLEADLLRSLGSAWLAYTDPGATGSGMMGVCLVNPLKDAEKAERALTALQALANAMMGQAGGGSPVRVRFHTSTQDGMVLRTLGIPFVAPTWSVHEGKLYVGLFPQTVLNAGARLAAGGDSILDKDPYIALRDRLGGGAASAVVFVDLPRTAEGAYQNLIMLSQMGTGMLAMFSTDPVPTLLPPFAEVQPLLSPAGQIAWSDDAGYHSRSISPFPGSMMLGPQGGTNMTMTTPVLVGTLLPALGASRRAARQMKSTTQCRGIVQAQITFAMGANKERLSNDIGQLIEGNYFTHEYVISPNSNISPPREYRGWDIEQQKQWVRENASYILIPDLKADINSGTVAVFERPDHGDGAGIAVGFNDGSARFMNEWEARELIEAQTGKTLEELIERQRTYQPAAE